MADVFVSYKKEDFARAGKVVAALQRAGYTVWWDSDLSPRTSWDVEIESQIASAKAVLVLWSLKAAAIIQTEHGPQGTFVRKEADYALGARKYVPAWIERCDLPLAFRDRQTADLSGWDFVGGHAEWTRALGWIAALVSPAVSAPAPTVAVRAAPAPAATHAPKKQLRPLETLGTAEFWREVAGISVSAANTYGNAFDDNGLGPFFHKYPEVEIYTECLDLQKLLAVQPRDNASAFVACTGWHLREVNEYFFGAALNLSSTLPDKALLLELRRFLPAACHDMEHSFRWGRLLGRLQDADKPLVGMFISANIHALTATRFAEGLAKSGHDQKPVHVFGSGDELAAALFSERATPDFVRYLNDQLLRLKDPARRR